MNQSFEKQLGDAVQKKTAYLDKLFRCHPMEATQRRVFFFVQQPLAPASASCKAGKSVTSEES